MNNLCAALKFLMHEIIQADLDAADSPELGARISALKSSARALAERISQSCLSAMIQQCQQEAQGSVAVAPSENSMQTKLTAGKLLEADMQASGPAISAEPCVKSAAINFAGLDSAVDMPGAPPQTMLVRRASYVAPQHTASNASTAAAPSLVTTLPDAATPARPVSAADLRSLVSSETALGAEAAAPEGSAGVAGSAPSQQTAQAVGDGSVILTDGHLHSFASARSTLSLGMASVASNVYTLKATDILSAVRPLPAAASCSAGDEMRVRVMMMPQKLVRRGSHGSASISHSSAMCAFIPHVSAPVVLLHFNGVMESDHQHMAPAGPAGSGQRPAIWREPLWIPQCSSGRPGGSTQRRPGPWQQHVRAGPGVQQGRL